jgi:hypothetical protein
VDSANPALAVAASALCVTSTVTIRTNATTTCTRNSQPTTGMVRYPVR